MPTYERSGKTNVPQWWLDKVLPLLADPGIKHGDVAKAASRYAGRRSPWKSDAISKFASGTVRTRELANGISAVFCIPAPFFTAPTEAAASKMAAIVEREEKEEKLAVVDGIAEKEIHKSRIDLARNAAVVSSDHGKDHGDDGNRRRPGRLSRGRS
jgi:hypothetical protein